MAKRIFMLLTLIAISNAMLWGQKKDQDPVLFVVEDTPVYLSEFEYIYNKTNGDKADYSKASLDEYLDLYVKFKLKVQRAKDMKLDTIPALQKELEGYRKQLADSYLIDKEVTERLIREAYERSKEDVNISHILIPVAESAPAMDSLQAFNQAKMIRERLQKGEDFATLAKEFSGDKSAKSNGGNVGFVTAIFPNGFYALESAAYTQKLGELSNPVRTNAGYHILKVNEKRPARGEIEVAHILLRKAKGSTDLAALKTKADSIYTALQNGAAFEELAKQHSEDKLTASKGGYIGFFGINRYEKDFENASFSLQKDGDYTQPVKTSVGYHIIKRVSKKEIQPYNLAKSRLEGKIKQDARFEMAKKSMIQRIKKESGFAIQDKVLQSFTESLQEDFLTYKWKAPKPTSQETLFAYGKGKDKMEVSLGDFTNYLARASRKRIQMGRNANIQEAVNELLADFVNENALKYEERQLEKKYPEFKALMREYEEGILLFEATKMMVWDKASQDTTGLKEFFNTKVKNKYKWKDRAVVSQYSLKGDAKGKIDDVRKYARKNSPEDVLKKFNSDDQQILTVQEKTFEKGRNDVLDNMKWDKGNLSTIEENKRDKSLNFLKIEKLLSPSTKTLKEARGYVVADFQDYLEKQWLTELRKDYKVDIKKKVFENLIKK